MGTQRKGTAKFNNGGAEAQRKMAIKSQAFGRYESFEEATPLGG